MNREQYDELQAWNWSRIKPLRPREGGSPKKFQHRLDNPEPDKPHFRVGRLLHAEVLGSDGEEFFAADEGTAAAIRRYERLLPKHIDDLKEEDALLRCAIDGTIAIVFGAYEKSRNMAHSEYKIWCAKNPGKHAVKQYKIEEAKRVAELMKDGIGRTLMTESNHAHALAMAEAVKADPRAARALRSVATEVTVTWSDPDTGLPCKGRVDAIDEAERRVIDLKSVRSIQERDLESMVMGLGYHMQIRGYGRGVRETFGWEPRRYTLICVEKEAPHDVAVGNLDSEWLEIADHELADIMTSLQDHLNGPAGAAVGLHPNEVHLAPPAWAYPQESDLEIVWEAS